MNKEISLLLDENQALQSRIDQLEAIIQAAINTPGDPELTREFLTEKWEEIKETIQ